MIGEIGSGSSFRGLLHYLVHGSAATEPRQPTWMEVRNLFGRDVDRLQREMAATASQNPRAGQPVLHVILSPAPEDRLDRERWSMLADRVLSELGLAEHQAVVVHHGDTAVPHLHLAVNRIHPERRTAWATWRSKTRLETILRGIERDWGLRRVEGRLAGRESERSAAGARSEPVPRPVRAQARHRADEPRILAWRRSLSHHFEQATGWSDLALRLEAHGVRLEARGRGLVVTDGEVHAKASSIGRAYSRGKLEARFGPFAQWRRDLERFEAAAGVYGRYADRGPGHPRARAALKALRSAGRSLGWRAASRLAGPLAPAVGSVVATAVREQRRGGPGEREAHVVRQVPRLLRRSGSWSEVEGRLRYHGLWIEDAPGGSEVRSAGGSGVRLVVTDGIRSTPLRDLGPEASEERLTARLGSWPEWQEARRELLNRARRLQRFEATSPRRTERWSRLVRLIQESELRQERHRASRAELEATEERLRGLLRSRLPRRTSPQEIRRMVRDLRIGTDREVEDLLRQLGRSGSGLLRRSGRRRGPEELRPAVREIRDLERRVSRSAPAARAAGRRLPRLRRRARLLNPAVGRRRLRDALLRAAARVGRTGLYSLLARAAPGLAPALTLVRMVRSASRTVERTGQRERERGGRGR